MSPVVPTWPAVTIAALSGLTVGLLIGDWHARDELVCYGACDYHIGEPMERVGNRVTCRCPDDRVRYAVWRVVGSVPLDERY